METRKDIATEMLRDAHGVNRGLNLLQSMVLLDLEGAGNSSLQGILSLSLSEMGKYLESGGGKRNMKSLKKEEKKKDSCSTGV